MRTILLTGATGFLGGVVLRRLLERPDTQVICLVRAPDDAAAANRLGVEDTRVEAIAGDVTTPGLGLGDGTRRLLAGRIDAIIHCAASVSFTLGLEESREINVEGTRRMLDLAARAPYLERFVHVSTAYVAGTHEGTFAEDDHAVGQGFRNAYEQSKHEAEALVRARRQLPSSIVRPSIVVGDSQTGRTSTFNVLYYPLQAFARGLTDAVPADPEAIVDVVPVDHVADGILAALDAPELGTLHLVAGDRAPRVRELATLAGEYFERPAPELVPPDRFGGGGEGLEAYFPYFSVRSRFDDRRAQELGLEAPPLGRYFGRIMDYAVATRWGRRPAPEPTPAG